VSREFDLDPLGRPLGVSAQDWVESYTYDPIGNQTSAAWPAEAGRAEALGERKYSGTRLLTAGDVRYEYDAAGRTVLRQRKRLSRKPDSWRYEWDALDRLVSALRDAGIPEGAEPIEVDEWVKARGPEWAGSKQIVDENNQPIHYTEETYEHPNGNDLVVFQDNWFGHQNPGEPGYQPPHVHVRPIKDTRNGQVPGAQEHYNYDR
jgi:YD repeat-containing protein